MLSPGKPVRRIAIGLGGLLFLLTVVTPRPAAAQSAETSLKELTQTSTAVVLGRASSKESFWNEKRTQIMTEVRIRVDENIKGHVGSEAVVTIPGGRVGNTLYEVSDMPFFDEGEPVLVFLWRHPSGKHLVTGGSQGKLKVEEDERSGEKTIPAAATLIGEAARAGKNADAPDDGASKVRLDDLLAQIKAYLNE